MNEIDTAIMMVTYNRLNLTEKMLNNLFENTKRPFNLVIVDNGSTDYTVDYLSEIRDNNENVSLNLNKENKGIAIGRNQCLKYVDEKYPNTKWYCTIDNDVLVPNGWLNECIDILQKNKQYAAIGVNFEGVNYPIVNLNGKEFQSKPQGNLGTACMVFNKSLHKMIGFFNTSYSKFYGLEDSDFGMRIRTTGLKLGYLKENGRHLGEGANDVGEYREFKTKEHDSHVHEFQKNCQLYFQRKKPIYIDFKDA